MFTKAGIESVEDLPRTAAGYSSKEYQDLPPQLRLSAMCHHSSGFLQRRMVGKESDVRVPNAHGLHHTT